MAPMHVPAWKRLGLKLRNEREGKSNGHATSPLQTGHSDHDSNPRKRPLISEDSTQRASKRQAQFESAPIPPSQEPSPKRRKSVTFAPDTKHTDQAVTEAQALNNVTPPTSPEDSNGHQARPAQPKEKLRRRSPNDMPRDKDDGTRPVYLEYLDQYHTSRSDWKFNKNKQGVLLKHAFDVDKVKADRGEALSAYIAGLQGAQSRERLQSTADTILEEVREEAKSTGEDDLYDGAGDESDAREQSRTEALRAQLMKTKIRLREAQSAEEAQSKPFQKRLLRRQRAEEILLALAESAPADTTPRDTTNDTVATPAAQHIRFDDADLPPIVSASKTAERKRKTPRRGKIRTGVPDDDSSSASDIDSLPSEGTPSESDSESSSESESDSDDDDDMESSSDSSEDEPDEEEANPIIHGSPRLDKKAVRELLNKQNGAIDIRPKPSKDVSDKAASKGRKARPFNTSGFYKG